MVGLTSTQSRWSAEGDRLRRASSVRSAKHQWSGRNELLAEGTAICTRCLNAKTEHQEKRSSQTCSLRWIGLVCTMAPVRQRILRIELPNISLIKISY